MKETPESEYVCGGYYLARLSNRAGSLSASSDLCKFFPDTWAIEWTSGSVEERQKRAAVFGISPGDLPGVVAWATASFSQAFGWPSAFYTLEAARDARAKFLAEASGIVTFGLGLHHSDVEDFLKAAAPPPRKPEYAPVGETGVFECVRAGREIAGGGDAAGFELLSTYAGLLTCSWLCGGLEKDCANQLGIAANGRGFVPSYADARRCARFLTRDGGGAESLWFPWLVTVYLAPPGKPE